MLMNKVQFGRLAYSRNKNKKLQLKKNIYLNYDYT